MTSGGVCADRRVSWLAGRSRGREILSYLDGHVGWARVQPPEVWSDASLVPGRRAGPPVPRPDHGHTACRRPGGGVPSRPVAQEHRLPGLPYELTLSDRSASKTRNRWAVAAASPRLATPSLARMLETCTLTVLVLMNRRSPI